MHHSDTKMSSSTHYSTFFLPETLESMDTTKKFIGAVEDEWQLYSDCPADYIIGPPIGFGSSSIVYAAVYHPSSAQSSSQGTPCALKVLDLDTLAPRSLQLLQRETTLMSLSKHPNVLRVRGSWMDGHRLYIALRLMNKGSAADVMRYGWLGGMEEDVVRCILRQALSGLNYLHVNGFIHRDVKAANLLIDDDGTVLLGDLGVAADLAEDTSHIQSSTLTDKSHYTSALSQSKFLSPSELGSSNAKRSVIFSEASPDPPKPRMGKRKSFVGTPCWMAPELIQGRQYDSSADIWSFGITALELTQGRPPKSREPPQRVLLRIIQEDPPTLDREGGVYKYSRAFKEIVDSCLVKDPSKRPTAEELLQTPFFRASKKKSYLVGAILKDLPPLTQRQERRIVNRISSVNSVESWDFATTINSPFASIHRRRYPEDVLSGDDKESLDISLLTKEPSGPGVSPSEQAKRENNPSSSHSTSNSSGVLASSVTPSTLSLPHTSPPSSYTESSDPSYVLREKLSPEFGPGPEPLVSIAENTIQHTTPISPEPILLPLSPHIPSRQFIPPSTTTPIPSTNQQSLWRKIKNNVRPPSRGDDGGLDSSPRKERGKIGGIFASASMGLLSKQSNRSLANVFKERK